MDRSIGALIIVIVGVFLFFYTLEIWFLGSILFLIVFGGAALAFILRGEIEDRMKRMEERIRELEEAQKKEKGS